MSKEMKNRLSRHQDFWAGKELRRPPVVFRIGDYFWSRRFKAADHLLKKGKEIAPELLNVEAFLEDYERMYQEICLLDQDGFWVAEPFTGIPWMEAMWGCKVYAGESSFISEPWAKKLDDTEKIGFDPENKWFQKYIEFVKALESLSQGRFPVGQPIMRGPSDVAGAVLGQTELVFAMAEEREKTEGFLSRITDFFLRVIDEQYKIVSSFHGGYSIGFYHLWAPGKTVWYQEDLSALLSPRFYQEFLQEQNTKICRAYDYSMIHLHPASFFILDDLLQIPELKVVQINKDVGGPSVREMLPHFRQVLSGKKLMIWGDLNREDLEVITSELPANGVFLNIVAPTIEEAMDLRELLETLS